MDILYYRINRKSNLILFDDLGMEKTKSTLNIELDNSADKSLGKKLDNILNTIISKYKSKEKEKEKDKLEIIHLVIEQYRKLKNLKVADNNLSLNMIRDLKLLRTGK